MSKISNFTKEFVYKNAYTNYSLGSKDANNLVKYIEACKDLKLEKKMKEEDRIQKLLEKIDEGVKRPRDSIDDVSIHLLEDGQ